MKIRVMLAGLLLVASSTSAIAAGPYVSAAGGVAFLHDSDIESTGNPTIEASYDPGFGFNVSAGYNFDIFRVEGEFGYKVADFDKFSALGNSIRVSGVDETIMSYMVNGYVDFQTQSVFTPYLGVGLGLINGEINGYGFSEEDNALGFQAMAGVGFNLNKNVTLDLSYRFQRAVDDFNIDGTDVSYMSSNIYGGVRFNF